MIWRIYTWAIALSLGSALVMLMAVTFEIGVLLDHDWRAVVLVGWAFACLVRLIATVLE